MGVLVATGATSNSMVFVRCWSVLHPLSWVNAIASSISWNLYIDYIFDCSFAAFTSHTTVHSLPSFVSCISITVFFKHVWLMSNIVFTFVIRLVWCLCIYIHVLMCCSHVGAVACNITDKLVIGLPSPLPSISNIANSDVKEVCKLRLCVGVTH